MLVVQLHKPHKIKQKYTRGQLSMSSCIKLTNHCRQCLLGSFVSCGLAQPHQSLSRDILSNLHFWNQARSQTRRYFTLVIFSKIVLLLKSRRDKALHSRHGALNEDKRAERYGVCQYNGAHHLIGDSHR